MSMYMATFQIKNDGQFVRIFCHQNRFQLFGVRCLFQGVCIFLSFFIAHPQTFATLHNKLDIVCVIREDLSQETRDVQFNHLEGKKHC